MEQKQEMQKLNISQNPNIEEVLNKINQVPDTFGQKPIVEQPIIKSSAEELADQESLTKEQKIKQSSIVKRYNSRGFGNFVNKIDQETGLVQNINQEDI